MAHRQGSSTFFNANRVYILPKRLGELYHNLSHQTIIKLPIRKNTEEQAAKPSHKRLSTAPKDLFRALLINFILCFKINLIILAVVGIFPSATSETETRGEAPQKKQQA